MEHQPSLTSKLLSCSQVVATLEKTSPQLPNEFVVAVRNRTHLTCWAATHTTTQSLPACKAWVSRGTRSLPPAQPLLTHLRAVLRTSTQESPHFPVPEVWAGTCIFSIKFLHDQPSPTARTLLLLPQPHMNVQYFLQSSCSPENKLQLGLMKHFIQHGKGEGRGEVRRGSTKFNLHTQCLNSQSKSFFQTYK